MKIPVSVGILTFNSAATLERALRSVENCDDIIVCDGGSTDATREIARRYSARIIEQDPTFKSADGRLIDYSGVRNQCLAAAKHPYFFYIDSDEAASPELINELERIAREGTEDGYRIPIRMWIGERSIEHSSNYPGYQYRIVRTDRGIRFFKPVHERPIFPNKPDPRRTTLAAAWYVFLDDEYVHNYLRRNWKFVEMERSRVRGTVRPWVYFTYIAPRHLRFIAGILVRTCRDRALYRWQTCMPFSVEWGRIRYHLAILRLVGLDALV